MKYHDRAFTVPSNIAGRIASPETPNANNCKTNAAPKNIVTFCESGIIAVSKSRATTDFAPPAGLAVRAVYNTNKATTRTIDKASLLKSKLQSERTTTANVAAEAVPQTVCTRG